MNEIFSKVVDMQQYKIDNLDKMKPMINRLASDISVKHKLSEEQLFDIRLVLSELIMNSFKHGKNVPFVDVSLDNSFKNDKIKITVADFGEGFDYDNTVASGAQDSLLSGDGRGIKLVTALCEKVTYNESGNSVSVVMKV